MMMQSLSHFLSIPECYNQCRQTVKFNSRQKSRRQQRPTKSRYRKLVTECFRDGEISNRVREEESCEFAPIAVRSTLIQAYISRFVSSFLTLTNSVSLSLFSIYFWILCPSYWCIHLLRLKNWRFWTDRSFPSSCWVICPKFSLKVYFFCLNRFRSNHGKLSGSKYIKQSEKCERKYREEMKNRSIPIIYSEDFCLHCSSGREEWRKDAEEKRGSEKALLSCQTVSNWWVFFRGVSPVGGRVPERSGGRIVQSIMQRHNLLNDQKNGRRQ